MKDLVGQCTAGLDEVEDVSLSWQLVRGSVRGCTLNIPMSHELPKAYDPSIIEERWPSTGCGSACSTCHPQGYEGCDEEVHHPSCPTNVTGRLHMGHMLNQTEMDIPDPLAQDVGDVAMWVPAPDHG